MNIYFDNLLKAAREQHDPSSALMQAISKFDQHVADPRTIAIQKLASAALSLDGEVEFDERAVVSEDDTENGVFVEAWEWFDFAGTEFDKNKADAGGPPDSD